MAKAVTFLGLVALGCGAGSGVPPVDSGSNFDASTIAPGPACQDTVGTSCRKQFSLGNVSLAYYGNYSLATGHPTATRAIVVVHGTNRDANVYFGHVLNAAEAPVNVHDSIVIAPLFQEQAQEAGELFWTDGNWREGGPSSNSSEPMSSFAALDRVLERLADQRHFPHVTTVVFAGHSAGAQVVQRFAAGSVAAAGTLAISYVVANPSSYLYFNDLRHVNGAFQNSGAEFSACPTYNSYKYGLENRTEVPYMAEQTDEHLTAKYLGRSVIYLLGQADTCNSDLESCNDQSLDKTCPAMLQGRFRLERGQRYWQHLQSYFSVVNHHNHEVPGVAHSGGAMFASPIGQQLLFQ